MESRSYIEGLSREMVNEITSFLWANDPAYDRSYTALMLSSSTLYKACIGEKLLLDFACANISSAENILKRHPHLLLYKGTTRDHAGNTLTNVTPIEIAYGSDHADMCNMTLPYLDQIEGGRQLALKLINDRFPDTSLSNYDFSNIVSVFMNQNDFELMKEAARDFIAQFKPRIVKQGKPIDVSILIDALRACSTINRTDRSSFTNTDRPFRRDLFWRLVIGGLQRNVPAFYAKVLCAGPVNILVGNPIPNHFKLKFGGTYYPLDTIPREILGRDVAVTCPTGNAGIQNIVSQNVYRGVTTCSGDSAGVLAELLSQVYHHNMAGLLEFRNELLRSPAIQQLEPLVNMDSQIDDSSCNIL